jgi:XamI-like restriction endonuclease
VSLLPPRWTLDQFTDGVTRAIEVFRIERLNEAREDYTSHFDEARAAVEDLLELSTGLTTLDRTGRAALADAGYLEALRYIAAPPVSFDDLETLSGVAAGEFQADGKWQTVIATVLALVDTRRFGWLADGREPTEAERNAAIVATAAQIASRRIMTARANEAKAAQEDLVRTALTGYGYTEVTARVINTLRDAPSPSEFCGESMLGSRKADFVIGLWDDRILAVECKVSNSKINSIKRVKNDAAVKAKLWIQEFGDRLIVPAAVIAGVYNPANLVSAQRDGLTIWWSHDIAQMISWIDRARPGAT